MSREQRLSVPRPISTAAPSRRICAPRRHPDRGRTDRTGELERESLTRCDRRWRPGFTCRVLRHERPAARCSTPASEGAAAHRLGYGHGDVIRGLEACWRGLAPWTPELDGRYYGRASSTTRASTQSTLAPRRRAEDARLFRFQQQMADRNGRGDRLTRPARGMQRLSCTVFGRRPHCLRRPRLSTHRPTIYPAAAAPPRSTCGSMRAKAVIIPGIGAGCSPIRRSAPMRLPLSRGLQDRCIPEWVPTAFGLSGVRFKGAYRQAAGMPTIDPAWGEPDDARRAVFAWCSLRSWP
jgi:hypothetical protein